MGQMKTVKLLGSEFNTYMPALLILVSCITLVQMMKRPSTKQDGQGLLEANEETNRKKMVVNTVRRRARLAESYTYRESNFSPMAH